MFRSDGPYIPEPDFGWDSRPEQPQQKEMCREYNGEDRMRQVAARKFPVRSVGGPRM